MQKYGSLELVWECPRLGVQSKKLSPGTVHGGNFIVEEIRAGQSGCGSAVVVFKRRNKRYEWKVTAGEGAIQKLCLFSEKDSLLGLPEEFSRQYTVCRLSEELVA